ncbi:metallophosphoesterase [Mycobacterium cookii]|uniref:Metallophosphatase n=1 Tax=Mycobacterium cookii TaxID=1775 RepID=A0A7I7L288_9MYCO|nr:metallophosphoesterase [Mycobacterium cookii]BBX48066.1 metallophosphatase [Mycobacterium cookii]
MEGYDIIGDIHGCAEKLEALLGDLGYQLESSTGAYRHPKRQAIFVGDLIDRGTGQLRVLEIVKAMVDTDAAQIVMGNHEFNAIAYATEHPAGSGQHLRRHNEKNTKQHQSFLDQLTSAQRSLYLEWFKTLPLWLDLGDIRVVHACWHEDSIGVVERQLGSNRFGTVEDLVRASTKGDELYVAIEILLKGPEISLVDHRQLPYMDKDGHLRTNARIRWWNGDAMTLRDIAEIASTFTTEDGAPYPDLPDIEIPPRDRSFVYTGAVPVFYGHYWRQGRPDQHRDWNSRSACVDFSAVKGGTLMAYRWSGEKQIDPRHYLPQQA